MFYVFLALQFVLFILALREKDKALSKVSKLERHVAELHETLAEAQTIIDLEEYPEFNKQIDNLLEPCNIEYCGARDIIAYGEVEIDETRD